MATGIKAELEQSKLRLEFFRAKAQQQPTKINSKWVEIYADRVKTLEKQLTKAESKARKAAAH